MNEEEMKDEEMKDQTLNADEETAQEEMEKNGEEVKEKKEATSETDKMAEELEKAKNDYLYLRAEYDNYRKRTIKEKAELIESASSRVLVDILPLIDDFERGIEANEKAEDLEVVKEGMKLIYEKFVGFLKNQRVEAIEAKGKKFDTDYHEAIAMIPAATEEEDGVVMDCVQKGYMLGDKVIRHAKVAVGKKQ